MLGNSSVMHMGYIFLAIAALIAFPENPRPLRRGHPDVRPRHVHRPAVRPRRPHRAQHRHARTRMTSAALPSPPPPSPSSSALRPWPPSAFPDLPISPAKCWSSSPPSSNYDGRNRSRSRADRLHPRDLGRGDFRGLHAARLPQHLPRPAGQAHRGRRRTSRSPTGSRAVLLVVALFAVGLYPNLLLNLLK